MYTTIRNLEVLLTDEKKYYDETCVAHNTAVRERQMDEQNLVARRSKLSCR